MSSSRTIEYLGRLLDSSAEPAFVLAPASVLVRLDRIQLNKPIHLATTTPRRKVKLAARVTNLQMSSQDPPFAPTALGTIVLWARFTAGSLKDAVGRWTPVLREEGRLFVITAQSSRVASALRIGKHQAKPTDCTSAFACVYLSHIAQHWPGDRITITSGVKRHSHILRAPGE